MKRILDRLTGALTMYRLVIAALLFVVIAALVASAFGLLEFSTGELALSLVVAVGVAVLTGWAFAPAFGLKPHRESSVITGLLVFLITVPSLNAQALAVIALAAALASASKYLIAIRGRHVLNPAAAGVAIVSLVGLSSQSWWVASPVLLPFVAVGAFLILYRTRKLLVGVIFMVLAVLLAVGAMLAFGSPIDAALQVALWSSPVVFLGGFMFSEPLTLPPLRRQQLVIAAVVAVVYALPLWLSALNLPTIALLSPALALIVGNVVAFFFGQRRGIKLTLSSRRQLTPTTWEFGFTPTAPVQFRPGQYMELTLPHRPGDARGYRRIFSIASAPADGSITFGIKFSEKTSTFKSALAALPLGTQLRATSVGGDFLLPEDPRTPVLLIAGGIGITPYISQLTEAAARDAVLVYSVTSPDELVYAEELERSGIRVLLIAPQSPPELPDTWRYLGAARLSAATLQAEVPALAERVVYVSGPPAMVAELKAALHAAGVRRVVSDYFTGY